MSKKLYLETGSGISGDMFVAAMLDLGADQKALEAALASLPVKGFKTEISRVQKSGIDCCDFNVILDAEHENHDHDMAYLYGPDPVVSSDVPEEHHHHHDEEGEHHCHCHEDGEHHHHHDEEGEHHCHCHEEGEHHHHHDEEGEHHCHCHEDGEHHHHHDEEGEHHCHCHEDGEEHHHHHHHDEEEHHCPHFHGEEGHHHHHHDEEHHCPHFHGEEGHHHDHDHVHGHHHHHEHRNLADVMAVIDGASMTDHAREIAKKIFMLIAEAEAKAHNLPIDEVHFHEVGAVDSIVDIISAAVCFDSLGISEVIVPKLSEGTGTVRCQHGRLPVPVPATLNIVTACGMPLEIMDATGEFVTPTGAAIACALATSHTLPSLFRIERIGLGAGKRAYTERAGILRALLISDDQGEGERDEVLKIETDIDDCSGEVLGYTLEKLMQAGALDVHYAPVFMKKNRPAWELTVICKKEIRETLEDIIFRETTTIGVREFPSVMRVILKREEREVETPFGQALVKQVTFSDTVRNYPEYESVKALAEENEASFHEVFEAVRKAAEELD